jgi:hypothetical protein
MATLKLKAGDDLQIQFTITDSDSAVVNLTGGTIRFKIAKNLNKTDAAAMYFDSYTSFTNAAGGIHVETIPDSVTALWTAGSYKYQVRFIDSSALVRSEDVDTCIIEENLLDDE